MVEQILAFIRDPQYTFAEHTVTTLELCVIPSLVAIAISIPLGVLVAQRPLAAFVSANTSGLARAIPTLAFLAIMLPLLGIGAIPSIIALTLLGIPPILLNTIAGMRGVDPAAIDAARGVGMTDWQILSRVRIPLVLPVVAAGVRTAVVQIVATVPLAALIGGGGYGDYVLLGVSALETVPLLVGAGCIAILALIAEFALAGLQRAATPRGLRVAGQTATRRRSQAPLSSPTGESLAA